MSNPVFNRIDQESRRGYAGFGRSREQQYYGDPQDYLNNREQAQSGPATIDTGRGGDVYGQQRADRPVTLDDVVMKAGLLFGLMLVTAGATWGASMVLGLGIAQLAMIAGFVLTLGLGLFIAFKKTISPALIVVYALVQGMLVGGVSTVFATAYEGLVTTAVVATLSVFVGMFLGWKTGIVRVTERSRRMMRMAIFGYLIFALVNFGFAMFGANQGWGIFAGGSMMGILVSVFAVGLASYTLALDFDSIQRAVEAQAPEKYSWLLAHGVLVTVVWLYLEILRLLAHLQQR